MIQAQNERKLKYMNEILKILECHDKLTRNEICFNLDLVKNPNGLYAKRTTVYDAIKVLMDQGKVKSMPIHSSNIGHPRIYFYLVK